MVKQKKYENPAIQMYFRFLSKNEMRWLETIFNNIWKTSKLETDIKGRHEFR